MAEDRKIFKGEVVSVGSEAKYVVVGDTVIYSPHHFEEVGEHHIIDEFDVWCVE